MLLYQYAHVYPQFVVISQTILQLQQMYVPSVHTASLHNAVQLRWKDVKLK